MMQFIQKKSLLWTVASGLVMVLIVIVAVFFPSVKKDVVFSQPKKMTAAEYSQLALNAEKNKDWAQAIWNFRQILELQKDDQLALEHLPKLYIQTGQWNQALEFALKLIEASPQSPNGFLYAGMTYSALGQEDKALESYQKAVTIDPKFAEAYFNLGFLSESNGRLSEAIDYYKKALEMDFKHARAAYNLGNACAGLERNEEAISAYKTAIAADPHYMDAFVNLSILLTKAGDYSEAIKYLDEARLLGYEAPELYLKELEPYRNK
jgi:tetratricopeptide (TPR) repeat protein